MAICTFFGHSDCPDSVFDNIRKAITDLYENHNVTEYYVGNHGNYDLMALRALKEMQRIYPQIRFTVVLAYYPKEYIAESIFPEELEGVPKKFCIDKRNRWMLKKSEFVVVYIRRNAGGAAKYAALAEKNGKTVIKL